MDFGCVFQGVAEYSVFYEKVPRGTSMGNFLGHLFGFLGAKDTYFHSRQNAGNVYVLQGTR